MKFILDMVHHNPGEPPLKSRFLDPVHLADYGFTGQVFKHINCVATFAASGVDCFPSGSPERAWLDTFTPALENEIRAAKARGLQVFYHVDLFVLPRRLVEHFRADICDPRTGRILLDRPRTLELHRMLFAELAARFPDIDGYIIRVGETYLFDTPYHVGNGPIPAAGPAWTHNYLYAETLTGREPVPPRWTPAQTAAYVTLLRFLREEVCVRHRQQIFFRTWDIFPDKLHAKLEHYLEVTDQVEPHPRLAFSIKHTALDFWRRVKVNDCLTRGRHPQIIEVQCQREYEGKGAYPNYIMAGVINGFEENPHPVGLQELLRHPQILGVYSWSRGGGWYGPYIGNELWPDLNAYILAQYVRHPDRSEPEIFQTYARQRLGLTPADAERFRELCLLSTRAILQGRYCAAFDPALKESVLPTGLWMRDDRLGGHLQLAEVLDYLGTVYGGYTAALAEKAEAVQLWERITALARQIHWPDRATGEFVHISAEYGLRLFRVAEQGWRTLIAGRRLEQHQNAEAPRLQQELEQALAGYDRAWANYQALAGQPQCPSLYEPRYFSLPGQPPVSGLQDSVEHYRQLLAAPVLK